MNFSKKDLQDVLYGESETLEMKENEFQANSRWSLFYSLVFQDKATGKFYHTSYSKGATEMQDESPFEHEGDEIECEEVFPREKTIIEYVANKQQEEKAA